MLYEFMSAICIIIYAFILIISVVLFFFLKIILIHFILVPLEINVAIFLLISHTILSLDINYEYFLLRGFWCLEMTQQTCTVPILDTLLKNAAMEWVRKCLEGLELQTCSKALMIDLMCGFLLIPYSGDVIQVQECWLILLYLILFNLVCSCFDRSYPTQKNKTGRKKVTIKSTTFTPPASSEIFFLFGIH